MNWWCVLLTNYDKVFYCLSMVGKWYLFYTFFLQRNKVLNIIQLCINWKAQLGFTFSNWKQLSINNNYYLVLYNEFLKVDNINYLCTLLIRPRVGFIWPKRKHFNGECVLSFGKISSSRVGGVVYYWYGNTSTHEIYKT